MEWHGYDDAATDVGDGFAELENISLYTKGEARRRLGGGLLSSLNSGVVSGIESGAYSVFEIAGIIARYNQTTQTYGTFSPSVSGSSWSLANVSNRVVAVNGGANSQILYPVAGTSRTGGLSAPTSVTLSLTGSGGTTDVGAHLVRARFYDPTTGCLSDPCEAKSITVTAGKKISVSVAFPTSGGFLGITGCNWNPAKTVIEMTAVGSETFYVALEDTFSATSPSSHTVDISDLRLIQQTSSASRGEWGHQRMPACTVVCGHRGRTFATDGTTMYWSRALYPESFDSTRQARKVDMGADSIVAMISFYNDLYLIGATTIKRFVYTSDPAAGMIIDVPGGFGAFNGRCAQIINGYGMVGWGKNGAWVIDAMMPKRISDAVQSKLEDTEVFGYTSARFLCHEPIRDEILFFYVKDGATCKAALCYGMRTGEWTYYTYRSSITSALMMSNYIYGSRLVLCSSSGNMTVGDANGDFGTSQSVTVVAGSTDTIINCTNTANAGQVLYDPVSGEERAISVASGSQITLSSNLSRTPSVGETLYVGSIRWRLVSDWMPLSGVNGKKRPTKMLIGVRPEGTMGTAKAYYYNDFSASAVAVDDYSADTYGNGVSVANNAILIDMDTAAADGYIGLPTTADWKRAVKIELVSESPGDGVRFIELAPRDDSTLNGEEE